MNEKYHHGKTPAAWAGMTLAIVGAIIAAVGFLMNIEWTLVIVGLAVFVGSAVVGWVMVKMGFGQDYAKE